MIAPLEGRPKLAGAAIAHCGGHLQNGVLALRQKFCRPLQAAMAQIAVDRLPIELAEAAFEQRGGL